MIELQGTVDRIIFASNDDRFTVLKIKPEHNPAFTATIYGKAPLIGQLLSVEGDWVVHPKFGSQFKVSSHKIVAPSSVTGIQKFLASGAISGIGPAMAKRIVDEFGDKTLEIMEHSPKELLKIQGIGPKTLEKIHASYMEQNELSEVMLWLEEHGLSSSYAGRVYAKYGSFAIEVMSKHPYRLAQDVDGIGFIIADKIAMANGIHKEDYQRIKSGLNYVLSQVSTNGHCCIPHTSLIEKASKLLEIEPIEVQETYNDLVAQDQLRLEDIGHETLVYPPYLYNAEEFVAHKLLELQNFAKPLKAKNINSMLKTWECDNHIKLAPQQQEAIRAAMEHGVFVLTGGPGTGKTTIVKGILSLLSLQGLEIKLAAPTGRAAKRLAETSGHEAFTIHRLLEAGMVENELGGSYMGFARNENEPLEADAIILDEVSMVDISLMERLLEAVPLGCRLILVGDVDQLPAVGPGSVLKDIIRSQKISCVKLTEIFRQADTSSIVTNAHIINSGRLPEFHEETKDFQFIELEDDEAIAQRIVEICQYTLPEEGYDKFTQVQVLSPMHRLPCGVENLNLLLQANLNPASPLKQELKYGTQLYRVGDKVMHIRNNYQKGVFNGDIGFIKDVTQDGLAVEYPDSIVKYEKGDLAQLTLAYATSVHKSQGSEYPVIIMPLSHSHYIMLQRNLLYTAITRAREKVILLGSSKALFTAVNNNRTQKRYTLLAERLAEKLNND